MMTELNKHGRGGRLREKDEDSLSAAEDDDDDDRAMSRSRNGDAPDVRALHNCAVKYDITSMRPTVDEKPKWASLHALIVS